MINLFKRRGHSHRVGAVNYVKTVADVDPSRNMILIMNAELKVEHAHHHREHIDSTKSVHTEPYEEALLEKARGILMEHLQSTIDEAWN